jgi:hypothetical protein
LRIGLSLLGKSVISSLQGLFGESILGIRPSDLDRIEISLRSLLISKELGVLRVNSFWDNDHQNEWWNASDKGLFVPFNDHLLDYEFISPEENVELLSIDKKESSFLIEQIKHKIQAEAVDLVSRRVRTEAGALSLLDDWYEGTYSAEHDYDEYPFEPWADYERRTTPVEVFLEGRGHPIFFYEPVEHAQHIVRCYKSGISIYSDHPIGKYCRDHIFWNWPDKIFADFDKDYRDFVEEVRGPGNSAFVIPPVMLMAL